MAACGRAPGDTLTLGATSFDLVQYHFHAPSEHTLSGRRYPMEMHMVHRSAAGRLAVVGRAHRRRPAQPRVRAGLEQPAARQGRGDALRARHGRRGRAAAVIPRSYRYQGSLTTPPCTEGVEWVVLSTPIELDRQQIGTFGAIIHGNSRPVQALNGRTVLADVVH